MTKASADMVFGSVAGTVGGQSSGLSHANNAETLTSSKVALFELYTLAMNVSHLVKSSFVGCLRSMPSNSS